MDKIQIYIKGIYGGGFEARMRMGVEEYIIENAIEILEKLALENGFTPTLKPGQKIYRAKINT